MNGDPQNSLPALPGHGFLSATAKATNFTFAAGPGGVGRLGTALQIKPGGIDIQALATPISGKGAFTSAAKAKFAAAVTFSGIGTLGQKAQPYVARRKLFGAGTLTGWRHVQKVHDRRRAGWPGRALGERRSHLSVPGAHGLGQRLDVPVVCSRLRNTPARHRAGKPVLRPDHYDGPQLHGRHAELTVTSSRRSILPAVPAGWPVDHDRRAGRKLFHRRIYTD